MDLLSTSDATSAAESLGASTVAFLKNTWQIVRRRKWLLCAGWLLVYALGSLYYFSRDYIYEARASVLVHLVGDALTGRNEDRPNYIPTHMQMITSTAVLDRALEKLGANDTEDTAWPSVDQLADSLKVTCQRDTEILNIAFQTKDKSIATRVVEAVVASYLEFVNETHRSSSKDVLQILTQQKDELDRQLQDKESQLLALQQKEGFISLDEDKHNVVMARLMAVNDALTQARVRRLENEARFQSLQAAIAHGESVEGFLLRYLDRLGSDTVSSGLGIKPSSEMYKLFQDNLRRDILHDQLDLDRLTAVYGPNYPKVKMLREQIRLLQPFTHPQKQTPEEKAQNEKDLRALAQDVLQNDIKEAKTLEADLQRQFESEKEVALQFNARRAPFVALDIELKRLRSFYETINLRIRQLNLGGDVGAITTQILEPPQEPTQPVFPNLKKIGLISTILGMFLGLALCYGFEWWDTGYRGPEDIAHHLGLPVVGHIPEIRHGHADGVLERLMEGNTRSAEAEAFRTLRTALMLCTPAPRKFSITSPVPGDGKTLIGANLAISFAKSGLRTLLIDGDLRRSRMHQIFELSGEPGLSHLLQQDGLMDRHLWAAICATKINKLDVLPTGPNPPLNPAELLSGESFAKIIAWAESRYDRIICDSPPILAVSDCALIGRLLDGALLVIHADKNDRVIASRARDALRSMNCPLLGVIINGLRAGSTYGYGYYHKPGYYGYDSSSDEKKAA
jgi:capsular exopolysaccharide synthesis family protein